MEYLFPVIIALLATIPFFVLKKPGAAISTGVITWIVSMFVYYFGLPSLVHPLGGAFGGLVLGAWVVTALIDSSINEKMSKIAYFPIIGVILLLITHGAGCSCGQSDKYHALIGTVEKKEWTQDVQPKDPKHVRLVPLELAYYSATKQLGEVPGSIGSQFEINKEALTLQLIKGELWYVAPFDFKGFGAWQTAGVSPGYVMVHGEDPKHPVVVEYHQKYKYMTSSLFWDNLERHIYDKYCRWGLDDFSFEIDESGKAFWVVTVYEKVIGWGATKVRGVVVVDPIDGTDTFYALGSVPDWIDRVIPADVAKDYAEYYGKFGDGFMNSWYGKKDIFRPGSEPNLVYGSNGDPQWVIDLTSGASASKDSKDSKNKETSSKDNQSLIGLIYMDARTGKAVMYHASGGTDVAILELVNNKVSYKNQHGDSPVLYNIYGHMTAIVPLLGQNHTYMGVALVDVATMESVEEEDIYKAAVKYQALISSNKTLAPDKEHEVEYIEGVVRRFMPQVTGGETMYYLQIDTMPKIFTGNSSISEKLPLTLPGDRVKISFLPSEGEKLPLKTFENFTFQLSVTGNQKEVNDRVEKRGEEVEKKKDTKNIQEEIKNIDPEEYKKMKDAYKKSNK